jgi:hypothetical protein
MATQKQKNGFFRKTYQKTARLFKAALIGAALTFAVAGCSSRRVGVIGADGGPVPDSGQRPDVVSVDTVKPRPDAGVPPAYSYTVKNLIGDYLNRELLDRDKGMKDYPFTTGETTANANPFSDGKAGTLGPTVANMYRIDGSKFLPFMTTTIQDSDAALEYSQQQDLWVNGHTQYDMQYDDVVGIVNMLAYTLKFKGQSDDLGIPVCTNPTGSDYSTCDADSRTDRHRLYIGFLEDNWVVTEMSPPATPVDNEFQLIKGGQIKIAKEAISGILSVNKTPKVNDSFKVDDLEFRIEDVVPHGSSSVAIFSIWDSGKFIKKEKVEPGTTKEFNISGKPYKLHVFKVAPGYTFGAKWVDAAILSQELKLTHGFSVDHDNVANKPWKVILGWKNKILDTKDKKDTNTNPDHLRTIIIYSDDIASLSSGRSKVIQIGDYVPILLDPVKFKFSFNGLSATNSDYTTIRAELQRTSDYHISPTYGPRDSSGMRMACTIHAPYVRITSSKAGGVFTVDNVQGSSPSASASDDKFYIATSGAKCNGSIGNLVAGTLFMNESHVSNYTVYLDYAPFHLKSNVIVKFPLAGDGVANEYVGLFNYRRHKPYVPNAGDFGFAIGEEAGIGVSKNTMSIMGFGLLLNGASSTFNFNSPSGPGYWFKMDHMSYMNPSGPVSPCHQAPSNCHMEEGGFTDRGSRFENIEKTLVEFQIANKLVYSHFYLAKVK